VQRQQHLARKKKKKEHQSSRSSIRSRKKKEVEGWAAKCALGGLSGASVSTNGFVCT
jgi:hypothetical protein